MNTIDQQRINQWVREGLITSEQAQKMIADVTKRQEEYTSNRLIIAISTIGSILLGMGAIFFVASNWATISAHTKTALLISATAAAYIAGYLFKYKVRNLPRVGASLLFLGSLLFGATVFLIAQIYHVPANNATLVLLWLIGILPSVYAWISVPTAALSALLFFIWATLCAYITYHYNVRMVAVLYSISGLLLFNIGIMHHMWHKFKSIGHCYIIAGINIAMFGLFLLSFQAISGTALTWMGMAPSTSSGGIFTMNLLICACLTFVVASLVSIYKPIRSKTTVIVYGVTIVLIAVLLCFFFFPATNNIYTIVFNCIFAVYILLCMFFGYNQNDQSMVVTGSGWLGIFVMVRYFDFFWDLMPRSLFFSIGGAILVLGSIFLERKQKKIAAFFTATPDILGELPKQRKMLIIIGLFLGAILVTFIGLKEKILRTGTEITLRAIPVDPRDLFRGDYVVLSYEISNLNMNSFPELKKFANGDVIFVAIESKNGLARAIRVSEAPISNALYIKGTVKNIYNDVARIDYGIEHFFVPEKKGLEIENITRYRSATSTPQTSNVDVIAAIDSSGNAVIKSLLIDGKEVKF